MYFKVVRPKPRRQGLKTISFLLSAIVATLVALPHTTEAGQKEEFELQERCGKRAEAWFKQEYGNGIVNTKDGQAVATYRNHYNGRLNKCFVLLNYQDIPFKNKKSHASILINLFDVNEKTDYGVLHKFNDSASPTECKVANATCSSETEWQSLVGPFMSE